MPASIKFALNDAIKTLAGSDCAKIDAEILLAFILEKPRSYLYTWPERSLEETSLKRFIEMVHARAQGKPVAHLTGRKEFWNQQLEVTPQTLIPRPETELLVESALEKTPNNKEINILELGTGTGAIAIAIGSERPRANIIATDIVLNNLFVAKNNATSNHVSNIQFICCDWLCAFNTMTFDIIISNPPYIAQNDPHLKQGDLRFESSIALVSEDNGLKDIKGIIKNAPYSLKEDGWLLIEHGYEQSEALKIDFQKNNFNAIQTINDLSGNPRVTKGCYN